MDDLEFELMTLNDRHIVNHNMLKSKDRDFKDIVFDCYSNLKATILVGWKYDMADMEVMFQSDFKDQLAKMKDKDKVVFSADVDSLGNIYSDLKLKYIIDPEHVNEKYRRKALENTIAKFKEEVKEYDNVKWEVLDYLKKELAKEEELFQKALIVYDNETKGIKTQPEEGVKKKRGRKKNLSSIVMKQLSLTDEELNCDLFVKEQHVLVPEIDRNNKYCIDGISYYGVYNNIDTGLLTKSRTLGYKFFKDGKINVAYFGIQNDDMFGPVLYVQVFGAIYNPYHILTREEVQNFKPGDLLVFNNKKKKENWTQIIQNTWEKAVYMDDNPEDFTFNEDGDSGIKNKKEMHLPELRYRSLPKERRYREDINVGLQMLLEKLEKITEGNEELEERTNFTHLGALEEVILRHINSENKIPKTINPSKGSRRINLLPGLIISIIKRNSDERADTVLFKDSKMEPNPFDIFNIFAYSQISNHIQTSSNKHVSSKAKHTGEGSNWVKWHNLPYLSTYFSKNNVPLGKNNMLHFHLSDRVIVERNKIKEIFKDIYECPTL